MKKTSVAVIGGDKRNAYMVQLLKEKGLAVTYVPGEAIRENAGLIEEAAVIAGGIPFKEAQEVLPFLGQGQLCFGGVLPEEFADRCREKGVRCFDFMKEETIAVYNTVATAEGAIAEAICGGEGNLYGADCLVLGFGRCGRTLCDRLKGLSARVSAASLREEELSWADVLGMQPVRLAELDGRLQEYKYIFNTIPKRIFDRELLQKTRQDVLLIDIASGEGGIDYQAARELSRKALHCLGLPGKYSPASSAQCLAAFIMKKL